jgi:hypothetical protein
LSVYLFICPSTCAVPGPFGCGKTVILAHRSAFLPSICLSAGTCAVSGRLRPRQDRHLITCVRLSVRRHMRHPGRLRLRQDRHLTGALKVLQLGRHHLRGLRRARQRDGGGAHGLPAADDDAARRPRGVHHEAHDAGASVCLLDGFLAASGCEVLAACGVQWCAHCSLAVPRSLVTLASGVRCCDGGRWGCYGAVKQGHVAVSQIWRCLWFERLHLYGLLDATALRVCWNATAFGAARPSSSCAAVCLSSSCVLPTDPGRRWRRGVQLPPIGYAWSYLAF